MLRSLLLVSLALLLAGPAAATNQVTQVQLKRDPSQPVAARVRITCTSAPIFQVYDAHNPRRVVVELLATELQGHLSADLPPVPPVRKLQFEKAQTSAGSVARLHFAVEQGTVYDVRTEKNVIVLQIFEDGESDEALDAKARAELQRREAESRKLAEDKLKAESAAERAQAGQQKAEAATVRAQAEQKKSAAAARQLAAGKQRAEKAAQLAEQARRAEEERRRVEEERRLAEEQRRLKAEREAARGAVEAKRQQAATEQRRADEEARRRQAEAETRRLTEEKRRAEEATRRAKAEQRATAERSAADKRQAEADKRRAAEETARMVADKQRLEAALRQAEADKRRLAEETRRLEAEKQNLAAAQKAAAAAPRPAPRAAVTPTSGKTAPSAGSEPGFGGTPAVVTAPVRAAVAPRPRPAKAAARPTPVAGAPKLAAATPPAAAPQPRPRRAVPSSFRRIQARIPGLGDSYDDGELVTPREVRDLRVRNIGGLEKIAVSVPGGGRYSLNRRDRRTVVLTLWDAVIYDLRLLRSVDQRGTDRVIRYVSADVEGGMRSHVNLVVEHRPGVQIYAEGVGETLNLVFKPSS